MLLRVKHELQYNLASTGGSGHVDAWADLYVSKAVFSFGRCVVLEVRTVHVHVFVMDGPCMILRSRTGTGTGTGQFEDFDPSSVMLFRVGDACRGVDCSASSDAPSPLFGIFLLPLSVVSLWTGQESIETLL